MAGIKSTFYDTLPDEGVNEVEWAKSAKSRGPLYGVDGPNDLRLTAHPTTPYAVNLSPGKFWGHGIWDETESVVRVQCVAPAQGAYRWDLIGARRDWQPTGGGPTSLLAVQGSIDGSKIVSVRENRPGEIDDQPIWAVQWKGGQTQPNAIVDLRCWPSNGGVEVADKLALSYLDSPGAAVKVGNSLFRFEPVGNGVWGWREYPFRVNALSYTPAWSGFENRGDTHVSKGLYWVEGDKVTVQAMIQSGRRASLGLGTIGFSLPPGLPAGADFMASGSGIHSMSGTGGLLRTVTPVVGPGQAGATLWVDKDPFVSPGRAGYGWGEGSTFHVQIAYRT